MITDTATLLVCDPMRLKHRLTDDPDWWTWPPEEQVSELNSGNAVFVDLGADGEYTLQVSFSRLQDPAIELKLACPSGHLFIGAGEEATCSNGEPQCLGGGTFLSVHAGSVSLSIGRNSGGGVHIGVVTSGDAPVNRFREPLVLK